MTTDLLSHALERHQARDFEAAETAYRRILTARPDCAELHSNLGSMLAEQGRLDEARAAFETAIALRPEFAQAHCNLGGVLRSMGRLADAERHLRRAVACAPDYWKALHNLGQVLHEREQFDAAINCYEQALHLQGGSVETIVNLAAVRHDQERYDEAQSLLARAIALRPAAHQAHHNLGRVLQAQGQLEEALRSFDTALVIEPNEPEARLNRAYTLLQLGRYSEGWAQYEWRWHAKSAAGGPRNLPQPLWNGSPLAGRTILVHAEQGVGDEVMFASCYRDLISEGAHCTITCDQRLAPLFRRSFPTATLLPVIRGQEDWHEIARQRCDFQTPAGSLPRYLRGNAESFPRQASFLVADERRVQIWRSRLAALGQGPKIGISWRAGTHCIEVRQRSTALAAWRDLLAARGVHFVNLQYGDCAGEIAELQTRHAITVHHWPEVDPLIDLDGFAAQIAALDLVISVGNATVHLAGALGKPTWALLPCHWGWRWLAGRTDTAWYRSVRLFRLNRPNHWQALFERLRQEWLERAGLAGCAEYND